MIDHSSEPAAGASLRRPLTFVRHVPRLASWIIGITLVLLVFGMIMVLSSSSVASLRLYGWSGSFAFKQFIAAGVGLALAGWLATRPVRQLRRLSMPLFVLSGVLLVAVLVIGAEVGGQRNWIDLGPLRLQPSELAKLALILWVPHVLTLRETTARTWSDLLGPVLIGGGITVVLVLLERDLGTPMVMAPIILAMLWAAGAPLRVFLASGVMGLAGIAALTIAAPYRMERFTSWLNPWADPEDTGHQAIHGQFALGTGGLWGEGLGAGKEKWGSLPAAHTDFILGVIGEEAGLIGTLSVLLMLSVLTWAAFRIAMMTPDPFVRYSAVGIGAWIGVQSLVNIGAVIGALPITGVTLPLVSYGGSSLLFTLMACGILVAYAIQSVPANATSEGS